MEDHHRSFLLLLESRQHSILGRIQTLQSSLCPSSSSQSNGALPSKDGVEEVSTKMAETQERLSSLLLDAGISSFRFCEVPSDYYDRSFEERRGLLSAASIDHLCKSIVMVNTQAPESVKDCSNFNNSKYYVVVVQYTARLNAEKVKQFLYNLNEGKIPKKRFNMRLAPEDEAHNLTGFTHNAVTPIGMKTKIPVILSDAIAKLQPEFFWLGGGEVDLKLGINTTQFINYVNPFIADCT